jgi:hypothetical protein
MLQLWPLTGQPHIPPQPSAAPQVPSTGQVGTQHLPMVQARFSGQPQVPPQPLSPPQLPSAGHFGTQHLPLTQPPLGQPHLPPQPLSAPQVPSTGHFGTQTQRPWTQRPAPGQGVAQAQVSTHLPLLHSWPSGQAIPAHESATQTLRTQVWPAGHWMPAHSLGGVGSLQVRWQVVPDGHMPLHDLTVSQRPVPALQNWLAAHFASPQGAGKQPATHAPPMQVWLAAQVLPAQGSTMATQVALHCKPLRHTSTAAQGSP